MFPLQLLQVFQRYCLNGEKNDMYMNTQTIKNFFIMGAERIDIRKYPDKEWGYGQLNLKGFFDKIVKIIIRD